MDKKYEQIIFEEKMEKIKQYVTSAKGKSEIKKSIETAKKECARFRKLSKVNPADLLIPMGRLKERG